jgi:polyhydroxyalkanoate synthase
MPAAMHSYYLRQMYQENRLIQPGALELIGVPIDLSRIATPSYLLATREDHIAPWKSAYAGARLYSGPKRFTLAASGHIAGVVNPPAANKYSHFVNGDLPAKPDDWLAQAKEVPGSWWPEWQEWVAQHAGDKVPARKPGDGKLPRIEPAPGSYVLVRATD